MRKKSRNHLGGGKSEDEQGLENADEAEEIPLDNFCTALRLLTEEKGTKILSDKSFTSKVIEIINGFEGFKDLPPSIEFILRTIIMKSYGQRLLAIKDWDDESSQLVTDFVYNTGLKEDLSEAVFECLAYAVGKVSRVKYVIVESSIKQRTNSPKNINVDVTYCNTKDFYHCNFLKREKLFCVIFEAERYAGKPDFAVFRRKAERLIKNFVHRKVAYGVGFYNMQDRNDFLEMINDESFMAKIK